ncbi:mannose-1-phosphate guanylyltransferase/mannose-6-phosphate isomerase [Cupriavidus sp. WS]|uniref:mannose-1-phosphate guanylyltransferase/mannose-6-phosphate isomerase n=1 Tax=Cupriavidus sp. WS TaxID=1312922 RepID=UPI00035E7B2D|nr:mannose-1-phosphate guanylyltransferase/mannose-6-phosphate isomerase [Cupriavidus sp. WS]
MHLTDVLAPAAAALPPRRASTVQPVILAGGAGTRLWPLSREQMPKPLIAGLLDDTSLLCATAARLVGIERHGPMLAAAPRVIAVCGEAHRFAAEQQLRASGHRARLLREPCARNTAPALTVAALDIAADDPAAVMVAMPADHAIADAGAFRDTIAHAAAHARHGAIVTLGVAPTAPESGYGYLRLGDALDAGGARALDRFVEKPPRGEAEAYVASGNYWWNSGIFVVRADVWLDLAARLQPDTLAACRLAHAGARREADSLLLDTQAFAASPAESIDYAIMERLADHPGLAPAVVVPLDAGWGDLGAWDAIWQRLPHDGDDNAVRGQVLLEGAHSTLAHAGSRLVVCVGTRNLAVVETPDAVLVADLAHVQQVKAAVERLRAQHPAEASQHRRVERPWGRFESIDRGERFQVKRLVVEPGARLSLQMHHHRAEHWIVVRGTARVTRGDESFLISENQSTYIPLGVAHRLENPGKTALEIIEVQSGSYLGEDDIVRLEDTYGRLPQ